MNFIKKILKKSPRIGVESRIEIQADLISQLDELAPGTVLSIVAEDGHSEFIIIAKDDFDHILDAAGMETRTNPR